MPKPAQVFLSVIFLFVGSISCYGPSPTIVPERPAPNEREGNPSKVPAPVAGATAASPGKSPTASLPIGTWETTIVGTVFDSAVGSTKPVPGAVVAYSRFSHVLPGDSGYAVTDEKGYFSIALLVHDTDSVTLSVQAGGFSSYSRTYGGMDLLGGSRRIDIPLVSLMNATVPPASEKTTLAPMARPGPTVANPGRIQATHGVCSLAFTSDGTTLAGGSCSGGMISFWDLRTRQATGQMLKGQENGVFSLRFSPDNRILASGGCTQRRVNSNACTGGIYLWNVDTRQSFALLTRGMDETVQSFSADGTMLASVGGYGSLALWNVSTGQQVDISRDRSAFPEDINSAVMSPDWKTIALTSYTGAVTIWDLASHRASGQILHGGNGGGAAFSPDGQTLIQVNGLDASTSQWDLTSRQLIAQWRPLYKSSSTSILWAQSPDGRYLAYLLGDNTISVWDLGSHTPVVESIPGPGNVVRFQFAPDGKTLVSSSSSGDIALFELSF